MNVKELQIFSLYTMITWKRKWNKKDYNWWTINYFKPLLSPRVEELRLNNDNINNCVSSYIPENLGTLVHLKKIQLKCNDVELLPESLGNLKKLAVLQLDENQLKSLPTNLYSLTSLIILHINYNKFTELPETIGNLINLVDLQLEGNSLTILPNTIGCLNKLEILSVSHNSIISLPETIGQLLCLKSLFINENKITLLPQSLGQLTNLKTFYFQFNFLQQLPDFVIDWIKNNNDMEIIYSNNPLQHEIMSQISQKITITIVTPRTEEEKERSKISEMFKKQYSPNNEETKKLVIIPID
jgi:Leucine-rich repeat (LRR) protein